jgi:hypothetical protein
MFWKKSSLASLSLSQKKKKKKKKKNLLGEVCIWICVCSLYLELYLNLCLEPKFFSMLGGF